MIGFNTRSPWEMLFSGQIPGAQMPEAMPQGPAGPVGGPPPPAPKPMMFGKDADLWPLLLASGAGMLSAPPGSDFGQALGYGLGGVARHQLGEEDRKLNRRYKQAQIGALDAKSRRTAAPKTRTRIDGDRKIVEQWDGARWQKISEGQRYKRGVKVTVGGSTIMLPKGAQTGAANKVLGLDDTLNRMDTIAGLYRPEFSEYATQGKAWLARQREKLGIGGDTKLLREYSAWKSQTQQFFNEYRKQITGVAAGPKEMAAIEASIPNTDDSAPEYQAKMQALVAINKQIRARYFRALGEGLKPGTEEFKQFLAKNPLGSGSGDGGLSPEQQKRLEELRRKQGGR